MSTASRRCMVFKCGKTSKDRHLSFHSFPKRKDIRDKWFLSIKLGQPDWTIPKCSSSKYYAICSRHFESNCFRTVKHKFDMASRNTLKPDAVPTLYMDGKSHSLTVHNIPQSSLSTEQGTATTERLPAVSNENGTIQNNFHVCGDEKQKVADSVIALSSKPYETAPSLYIPTSSTQTPTNPNLDEKSPRKYALASRRCMVFGCGSTSRNRSLSFHAFPKKPELREAWLKKIKVNRPNWSPNWPESNYYAVCSRHFTPDCFKTMKHNFCSTSRNTLRPDAVPSLFLSGDQELVYNCNLDYASQHQSISHLKQHLMLNGDDESNSYQGNMETHEQGQQVDSAWMAAAAAFPSCITEIYSENGSWSPGESDFVDASTQTVPETNPEPKQTRTVRVQTMITIKKSMESKMTQYDLPKDTKDEATNYEQCHFQSQTVSLPSSKLQQSNLDHFHSPHSESDNLNTCSEI